jgi:hypothetical protein
MMQNHERSSAPGLTVVLTLLTAAVMAGQVYGIAKGVIGLF